MPAAAFHIRCQNHIRAFAQGLKEDRTTTRRLNRSFHGQGPVHRHQGHRGPGGTVLQAFRGDRQVIGLFDEDPIAAAVGRGQVCNGRIQVPGTGRADARGR